MKTCAHYANLQSHVPLAAGNVPLQMERTQHSSITNRAEHLRISSATDDGNKKCLENIFSNAWNIIDQTHRFVLLYKTLYQKNKPRELKLPILEKIEIVKPARDTIQHLFERIDQSLLKNKMSFYGILKWVYSDPVSKKAFNIIAISGIFYSENHTFKAGKYDSSNLITNIILETINREGERIEINLSDLIVEIKVCIQKIELSLNEQSKEKSLQVLDWKSMRDIILKFKPEEKKN